MLHVALTGNIASGKSNASHVFAELGAHIIDADVIAHELLEKDTPTYRRVVDAFGVQILNEDGTVNRRVLGAIVFNDEARRMELNAIVHPEVRAEVLRRMYDFEKDSQPGIIIVDAALMIESGFYKQYDKLIVVMCDPALQIARVTDRDGLTPAEARARMAAQMPAEEKVKLADYVINTSGTFRQTRLQIEDIYKDMILYELRLRGETDE